MSDWNPRSYARFGDLRLRPALDLLGQVPDLPPGAVVDLGCGAGAAGAALAGRFQGRDLTGMDASPAMLDKARATGCYSGLQLADAGNWLPPDGTALVFSNALFQWLPGHGAMLSRIAAQLPPGAVLAVQMPCQHEAPSHRLMEEVFRRMFPARPVPQGLAPVGAAVEYARLLADQGAVSAWETEYVQRLLPQDDGHPVRRFTESTGLRPWLAALDEAEQPAYLAAYDDALAAAYPREPGGEVLFPFRRVFFVLVRPL